MGLLSQPGTLEKIATFKRNRTKPTKIRCVLVQTEDNELKDVAGVNASQHSSIVSQGDGVVCALERPGVSQRSAAEGQIVFISLLHRG